MFDIIYFIMKVIAGILTVAVTIALIVYIYRDLTKKKLTDSDTKGEIEKFKN